MLGIGLVESRQIQEGFEDPEGTMTGEAGLKDDYEPGNLGFDPLGLKPEDPDALDTMKTKELNNGRLAVRVLIHLMACSWRHWPVAELLRRPAPSALQSVGVSICCQ